MNKLKSVLPFLKQHPTFKYDIVAPIIATGLVLISGTFISFMIAQNQSSKNRAEKEDYINSQIRRINEGITQRLRAHEQFVIAGSSLIRINPNITRSQWKNFVDSVNEQDQLFINYATGFIKQVPKSELDAFEKELRDAGLAPRGVFPESNKDVYYPIRFIEPMTTVNKGAVGYDLYSDEIRRAVAESARSTGQVSLTPPLGIPSDPSGEDEQTVVALHPVYGHSVSQDNQQERRASLIGYTFTAIRMNFLGNRIKDRLADTNNAFRMTDTTDGANHFLYATDNFDEVANKSGVAKQNLQVLGRDWQIEYALNQYTFGGAQNSPLVIFAVSMVVNAALASFLFMLMINRQARLAMHHEQEVQKTKDDLLALASHQLRTPATGVKQYLGMVLAGYAGKLTKEQKTMLSKANESNERQLEIINQLLYVAKADAGQLKVDAERFNVVDVAQQVAEEQRDFLASKEIKVQIKAKTKPLNVYADRTHTRMILENLLTNAIKYSYPKSKIQIYFTAWRDRVAIHVSDRGVGIGEAEMDQLFKKFSRIENKLSRQVGGSGIGLFLAQQLAQVNGSEIVVESELDNGSTFTLIIPRKSQKVS